MTVISKIKNNDNLTHLYQVKTKTICSEIEFIHKENKSEQWVFKKANHKLAETEAIASNLYRILGDTNLTPKVRVVAENQANIAIISKKLPNYIPATLLTSTRIKDIIRNKKRETAKLLVTAFLLEENDLNLTNWGYDFGTDKLVRIDTGQTLWSFSCQYYGFGKNDHETCLKELKRFPNLIFSPDESFKFANIIDIQSFPNLTATKPCHWPTNKFPELNTLTSDYEFIYWKNYYLTKFILLDLKILTSIVDAHAREPLVWFDLLRYLTKKIDSYRSMLLHSPEYRTWLIKNHDTVCGQIIEDITNYNNEFGKTAEKQDKYKDNLIDIESVKNSFSQFLRDVFKYEQQLFSKKHKLDTNFLKTEISSFYRMILIIQARVKAFKNDPVSTNLKTHYQILSLQMYQQLSSLTVPNDKFITTLKKIQDRIDELFRFKSAATNKGHYNSVINEIKQAHESLKILFSEVSDICQYYIGFILQKELTLETAWKLEGNRSQLPFSAIVDYVLTDIDLRHFGGRDGCLYNYQQLSPEKIKTIEDNLIKNKQENLVPYNTNSLSDIKYHRRKWR